jgi:hypothetical protein
MTTAEIISKLKETPYKFTYAAQVYDYLKKDKNGDAHEILDQLRLHMVDPANADISRPIREVLKNFRMGTF